MGASVTSAEHEEINRRFSVFRQWFLDRFMSSDGNETVLIVLPIDVVAPNYRDAYPGVPSAATTGLRTTYLSPIVGAPELAIPSR